MGGFPMSQVEKLKKIKGHTMPVADSLMIEIRLLDYKFECGRHRFLVTPVHGTGQKWTHLVKLNVES